MLAMFHLAQAILLTLPLTTHAASDGALALVPRLREKQRNISMAVHSLISKEVLEIVL